VRRIGFGETTIELALFELFRTISSLQLSVCLKGGSMVKTTMIALIMVCPLVANSEEGWLGATVFIKDDAIAKTGDVRIDIKGGDRPRITISGWVVKGEPIDIDSISPVGTVEEVDGDLVRVGRAWIQKKAVWRSKREAIDFYSEKIQRDPSAIRLLRRRGLIHLLTGEPTSAIEDFSEVIKLDAKDANAFGLRGNARRMAGKLDQAVEDFTEGMRLDPEDMGIIAGRGAVWMFKREFDKAIQDFTLALEIEPNPVVLNNRGAAYWQNDEPKMAIADYTEAIRLNPKYAKAYSQRARVLMQIGEPDKAIEGFEEAIRLDPSLVDAYDGLAYLLASYSDERVRNGKRAVENATKACELTGWKRADKIDLLAAAYAEAGEFKDAVKWAKKSLELAAEDDKASARERLALYQSGKAHRAKK
jgi:tetratricopeptide (TPR) repeat protein